MKQYTSSKSLLAASAVVVAITMLGCKQGGSAESMLSDARAAIDKRDPKAAEIHLKNLLQKNPENAEARFLLGRAYYDLADFRSAEKEFHRAVEAGFDRTKTVPLMFHAMLQVGDYQKLLDEYKNLAVEGNEVKSKVADQVARAYLAVNKKDEATNAFREALSLNANNASAKAGVIGMLAVSDKAAANSQTDALLKEFPSSFEAWVLKGDLEIAANKLPEAKAAFTKAVSLDANNALAHAKLAAINIDLKDYPAASKEIAELRRMTPNSAAALHLQALFDFRQGNLTQARDSIQLALKAAPTYLPAVALAGNIFLNLGQHEQAERQAKTLVELAPLSLQGHRLLGATYLRMNAPERALATALPLINKGVQDATMFTIAGEAYLKLNEPVKAGALFDQAIKLDPTDASKRTGLALSRMASGERDKAFDDLEAAVKLDTEGYQSDFALIMARVKEKEFDKALEATANLEKKQPKNPLAHNLKGMVLLAKSDIPGARKAFEQALVLDAAFFPAAANLASLDIRDKKPAEARQRYEAVLVKDPKNVQALIALARFVAQNGGKKEEVVQLLNRARTGNPSAVQPVLALANFHMENNQPREAIPLLQEGLQQHPDRSDLLDLLGAAYLRVNERSQALETYEKLLRVDPKSAALQYRMGEIKAAMRDDAGALAAFRKAAELQPKAVEPRIAVASILLRTGKKDEARAMAKELQKDLPASPAGLSLEGDLYAADQDWNKAAASFRKAYALAKAPIVISKLHQSLLKAGKTPEADAFLVEALGADPKNLQLQLYAGEYAITSERWAKASEHYRAVLAVEPNNGLALNNLAWASFKLNDPKAIQYAEQAYAALPQSPSVIDTLGYLLVNTGNPNRGVELLKQAIVMAPKSADVRLHLVEGYIKIGDKDNAKRELDTVLRENPTPAQSAQAKSLATKL